MRTIRPDLQLELPLAGAAPAAAGGQASLPLDEPPLAFRLRRSRRSGVTLAMDELGLQVNAPRGMALPQIEQAIRQGSRAIAERGAGRKRGPGGRGLPTHWCDGVHFPFLGREAGLRLAPALDHATFDGATLFLPLPSDAGERQIKDRTEGWLQQEAQRVLAAELAACARRLGLSPPPWRLSFAAGAWGGVDAAGRLRLSWRLIHLAPGEIGRVLARALQPLCRPGRADDLWDADAAPVSA